MTKAQIIAHLRPLNPSRRDDIGLVLYAEAFIEHAIAQAKIEKLGSIVINEKTKMPVDNPYIAVRDRTGRTMREVNIRTDGLWELVASESSDP